MTSGSTGSRLLDQIILSLDKSGDLAVKTYFKALASTQVPVADTNESNSHSVHKQPGDTPVTSTSTCRPAAGSRINKTMLKMKHQLDQISHNCKAYHKSCPSSQQSEADILHFDRFHRKSSHQENATQNKRGTSNVYVVDDSDNEEDSFVSRGFSPVITRRPYSQYRGTTISREGDKVYEVDTLVSSHHQNKDKQSMDHTALKRPTTSYTVLAPAQSSIPTMSTLNKSKHVSFNPQCSFSTDTESASSRLTTSRSNPNHAMCTKRDLVTKSKATSDSARNARHFNSCKTSKTSSIGKKNVTSRPANNSARNVETSKTLTITSGRNNNSSEKRKSKVVSCYEFPENREYSSTVYSKKEKSIVFREPRISHTRLSVDEDTLDDDAGDPLRDDAGDPLRGFKASVPRGSQALLVSDHEFDHIKEWSLPQYSVFCHFGYEDPHRARQI